MFSNKSRKRDSLLIDMLSDEIKHRKSDYHRHYTRFYGNKYVLKTTAQNPKYKPKML